MSDIDAIREGHFAEAVYRPLDPDGMCPNCCTPWKCNGPHEPATVKTERLSCARCQQPWPCDTRVVLDALDASNRPHAYDDIMEAQTKATDAVNRANAARTDADRLAEALRAHLEHYYDRWADGSEFLVYDGTPDTGDLRQALRQHDEVTS